MQSGELVHDRYRLEETLGSGGMAEVWRATDERLKRSVAIKFPASNLVDDPEFMVRFFAEAQAVARLSHPNVVKVLDFGEHEGHSYLVMEHVPGGSLKNVIGEPLEPQRACDLIRQAALAAGAAHAEGIVHRDIKPGNILIDEQGHVKLADFGIASTAVSERLTATGAAIGSPHYISPEQASGGNATPRSDVYALGVVLYELLTGTRPIDADNLAAIAIAQVEREPAPAGTHVEGLDPNIESIVMRCLSKEPAERFDDGNELARALEQPARAAALAATAAVALAADDDGEEMEEPEDPRDNRRGLMIAAASVAALLLVAGIAFALSRSTDEAEARSPNPTPSETKSEKPRRRKPTPTVTSSTSGAGTIPTPVSTPTPVDEDDDSQEEDDDPERPRKTRKPPPRPRTTKAPPPKPTQPPPTPAASPSA